MDPSEHKADPPRGHRDGHPWTQEEEAQLLHLRNVQNLKYADIFKILDRNPDALAQHIYCMKKRNGKPTPIAPKPTRPEHSYTTVAWTDSLDTAIIDGHRARKTNRKIAAKLHLPRVAIQERWTYLLSNHVVPADVLALDGRRTRSLRRPRDKNLGLVWTREQDEAIWALWHSMKDDGEIARYFPFEGKTVTAIKERRRALVNVTGPLNGREGLARKEGRYDPEDRWADKENLEVLRKWAESVGDGKTDGGKGKGRADDAERVALGEKAGGANKMVFKPDEMDNEMESGPVSEEGYADMCIKREVEVDKDGITSEDWKMAIAGAPVEMEY